MITDYNKAYNIIRAKLIQAQVIGDQNCDYYTREILHELGIKLSKELNEGSQDTQVTPVKPKQ